MESVHDSLIVFNMKTYTAIGGASEALGVSIRTVRRGERDGAAVIPERTAGRPCPKCGTDRDVNAVITLKNGTPRCRPVERKALVARPE